MKNNRLHIIVWCLYFIYSCLSDWFLGYFKGIHVQFFFFLTHHVVIFYTSYFVISRFSVKGITKTLTSLSFLLASLAIFFACHLLWRGWLVGVLIGEQKAITNWRLFITDGFVWYITYFLYALGYYFARRSVQKERSLRLSEEKRLKAESAFLRSQINPHFLQNTLNYFYAQALTGNTRELAESILLLSDIMRYSMESQSDGHHKILLSKEVDHLNNFIRINQLRFNNRLNVQFDQQVNVEGISIIPLVVITLVENAFKHGDLNDPGHPVMIRLEAVNGNASVLRFSTSNKKKTGPKEPSHGIGIENTKRRLEAVYGKDFLFRITENETNYTAELTIHLKAGRDFEAGSKKVYPSERLDDAQKISPVF